MSNCIKQHPNEGFPAIESPIDPNGLATHLEGDESFFFIVAVVKMEGWMDGGWTGSVVVHNHKVCKRSFHVKVTNMKKGHFCP